MGNYEPCQIKRAIWSLENIEGLKPWERVMIADLLYRAIPVKPYGKEGYMRCGKCGTRIRSGVPHSARDTVCRNCFTVIDWEKEE